MKKIGAVCLLLMVLAGCSATGTLPGGGPTVAACVPVILQDRQNQRQLSAGIAAIDVAPVTVMPPPVMIQPPPVVVTPTDPGMPPVVRPSPPTSSPPPVAVVPPHPMPPVAVPPSQPLPPRPPGSPAPVVGNPA